LTTRAYNNILVNIHRATEQLARSNGSQAAYDRAASQIGAQLGRLPYARQNGLIEYVNGSLQFYAPNEARQLYSDIRSTAISYLGDQVANGDVVIRNTGGNYFSNADILGPNAAIYQQQPLLV
ncbi:hypothetical protein, partial [Paludisphaera sp.]|uniref:hypothetical protein n=1 Tax=Paludisphaera sp. TaxID=2017432 RepID=UPI00301CBF55